MGPDSILAFAIGIALGAAFSPFWMKIYYYVKARVKAKFKKDNV